MHVTTKGVNFTPETAEGILLSLPQFVKLTAKMNPDLRSEIAADIASTCVDVANAAVLAAATKTTRLFCTIASDTQAKTCYNIHYAKVGEGVLSVCIYTPFEAALYGAVKKNGSFVFASRAFGVSRVQDSTGKFFKLIEALTGVGISCPPVL